MHANFSRVPVTIFLVVLFALANCQSDGVSDPSDEAGKKPEIDAETQLNALRVYYAAKAASEDANVADTFEQNLANISFSNDESKKKSFELAFASACASGEIPIDLFLSKGTDVNGEMRGFSSHLI